EEYQVRALASTELSAAIDPRPVNGGRHIVYASNQPTASEDSNVYSIYIMNADGTGSAMLLDGSTYGTLRLVDTVGELVFAGVGDHSLITVDVETLETRRFMISGHIDAVSSEGTH